MALLRQVQRNSQPCKNSALNPGIPYPYSVFVPGIGDLLGKSPAVKPDGVTRNGRAWVLTNGAAERRVLNSSSGFFNATECSFLVVKEYRGTLGTGDGAGVVALGASLTKRGALYFGTAGNVYFDFGGATNGVTRVSGTTSTSAGKTSVFLATTGPRGMRLFENGRLIGSNAASPVRTVDAALAFGLGDCYAGTSGNSAYTLAVPWNVQLSDELARSISENPWQIFAPAKRVLFASASAGGDVTITATLGTATASGLTASVTQSATVSGALGTATASGLTATVSQAATVAANLATATASGLAADVQSAGNVTISANIGIATASGRQANIGDSVTVSASRGTATAAGYTAAIEIAFTLAANRGTAQATGKTATIYASDVISASMGQGIASGYAALIVAGEIYARAPSGSGPVLVTQNKSRPVQTHATRYSNTGGIRR